MTIKSSVHYIFVIFFPETTVFEIQFRNLLLHNYQHHTKSSWILNSLKYWLLKFQGCGFFNNEKVHVLHKIVVVLGVD